MRLAYLGAFALMVPAWATSAIEQQLQDHDLPKPVLAAVQTTLQSVLRHAESLEGDEAQRLQRVAYDAVRNTLATQGYFSPDIQLSATESHQWRWRIRSGAVSTVDRVFTTWAGAIASDDFAQRRQALEKDWQLVPGKPFRHADWSAAKATLLANTQRRDFYFAHYVHSQAWVWPELPQLMTHTLIDSGPAVRLGALQVQGLRRVPVSLVHRYVHYDSDTPYDEAQLEQWRRQLQATGFFRHVFTQLNTKELPPQALQADHVVVPVQVQVSEAPAAALQVAWSLDDASFARAEAHYTHHVPFGLPLTLETGLSVDWRRQRWFVDWRLPPKPNGVVDSVGWVLRHSELSQERVLRLGLGWRRYWECLGEVSPTTGRRIDYIHRWSVQANLDDITRLGVVQRYRLPTIVGLYDVLRRDVDDVLDPRRGYLLALGLGLGRHLNDQRFFARAALRGQSWWSINSHTLLTLRGELGQVWAAEATVLPDEFGYRTGGAGSIRGYRYYGIGQPVGQSVIGTRTLLGLSAEFRHYFHDLLGVNVFVDVGGAAPHWRHMRLHWGTGLGLVAKTPAGPLSVDLAYGWQDKRVRLHFSLGGAF